MYKPIRSNDIKVINSGFIKYQITYPPKRPIRSHYDTGRWKKYKWVENRIETHQSDDIHSNIFEIQKELQEEKAKSRLAYKMIYCITKALISTQNKNLLLESKLNDVLKSSKESNFIRLPNLDQALRISKEHSNSDTLFNDPYHFKQKCIKNIEAFV